MNRIEEFLKDLTYNSKFRFLDEGKDKDKLTEIAKKRGIVLPAHDLAVFECIYAYTDKENKNKCTLPKEEVETSLETLVGKSIDLDHFRKNVVGYWIDAKLKDNIIYAYGIIFKGTFKEDYNIIQELFEQDNLAVSFEAWGDRQFKDNGSYDLTNIEFAGGALLLKSKPAFDGAGVLEMAKNRVLEFAKVMTEPDEYVHFDISDVIETDLDVDDEENFLEEVEGQEFAKKLSYKERKNISDDMFAVVINVKNKKTGKPRKIRMFPIHDETHVRNALARLPQATETLKKLGVSVESVKNKILKRAKELNMTELLKRHKGEEELEESRYFAYDNMPVFQALSEVECMSCKEKGMLDIMMIDYASNKCKVKCVNCASEMNVELTPPVTLTKRGRKVKKMEDWISKANIDELEKYLQEFDGPAERLSLVLEESLSSYPRVGYSERLEMSDEEFALVLNIEKSSIKEKIKLFPIKTLKQIEYASSVLQSENGTKLLKAFGISSDIVGKKLSRRIITIAMNKLLEKYKKGTIQEVIQEVAKEMLSREITKEELEKAYSIVEYKASGKKVADNPSLNDIPKTDVMSSPTSIQNAEITEEDVKEAITQATKVEEKAENKELDELKAKLDESAKKIEELTSLLTEANAKVEENEKAKVNEKIKARRDELAEFAKDMKDEDLLDDTKYEIAKKDKKIAELEAATKKNAPVSQPDLTKGAEDKEVKSSEALSREKVNEYAYGRKSKQDKDEDEE